MSGCRSVQTFRRCDGAKAPPPPDLRKPPPPPVLLLLLLVLQLWGSVSVRGSSAACPGFCECSEPAKTVKCVNKNLSGIPSGIPAGVTNLFITGNNISTLVTGAFGPRLDQLVTLNLSGNKIEVIEPLVFASMPNLKQLDLSNNRISALHPAAFGADTDKVRELNLSRALLNGSMVEEISDLLQNGTLTNLVQLELSENDLFYLPARTFSRLPNLKHLELRNNSIVDLKDTFRNLNLQTLDLSSNALKTMGNTTLAELSSQPQISVDLRDNPFVCDCGVEEFLRWLESTDKVVEKDGLLCASPESMRNKPILQAKSSNLECSFQGDMESVLQTSYVFLGIVLALIGVIFMFVLYLNRKGIKKWLYNVRDACRDHMEGYHYRYEINTDPRLTNLSSNSDV
ncbi:trophoblast glycoprotein [Heptranchias perlo]|uniref:trophoblast glycoprotein n=1 Tax=Heptranchias perlo TaxID=212740 RepID=UPI00355A88A3